MQQRKTMSNTPSKCHFCGKSLVQEVYYRTTKRTRDPIYKELFCSEKCGRDWIEDIDEPFQVDFEKSPFSPKTHSLASLRPWLSY